MRFENWGKNTNCVRKCQFARRNNVTSDNDIYPPPPLPSAHSRICIRIMSFPRTISLSVYVSRSRPESVWLSSRKIDKRHEGVLWYLKFVAVSMRVESSFRFYQICRRCKHLAVTTSITTRVATKAKDGGVVIDVVALHPWRARHYGLPVSWWNESLSLSTYVTKLSVLSGCWPISGPPPPGWWGPGGGNGPPPPSLIGPPSIPGGGNCGGGPPCKS